MNSTKSINIFTFVTFAIVIISKHSNADICLRAISEYGGINLNYNGVQAFYYIYKNISLDDGQHRPFMLLFSYIQTVYEQLLLNYDLSSLLGPFDYCKANIYSLNPSVIEENIDWECDNIVRISRYNGIQNALDALQLSYYSMREEAIQQIHHYKEYYDYLLDEIINILGPEPNLQGPKDYCYAECISQIRDVGGIDPKLDVLQTFEYVYKMIRVRDITSTRSNILFEYLESLFNVATEFDIEGLVMHPLDWCFKVEPNLNSEERKGNKQRRCIADYRNAGITSRIVTRTAFKEAYNNILAASMTDNVAGRYYNYMWNACQPYIARSSAAGPDTYCTVINSDRSLYVQTITAMFMNEDNDEDEDDDDDDDDDDNN